MAARCRRAGWLAGLDRSCWVLPGHAALAEALTDGTDAIAVLIERMVATSPEMRPFDCGDVISAAIDAATEDADWTLQHAQRLVAYGALQRARLAYMTADHRLLLLEGRDETDGRPHQHAGIHDDRGPSPRLPALVQIEGAA